MLDYRSADETQTDFSSLSAHKNKNHSVAHKKLIKHAVNKNAVSNANIHRQKINKYLTTSRGHTKNGFLSVTQTLLTPGQMTHFIIIWIPTMGSGSSDSRKKTRGSGVSMTNKCIWCRAFYFAIFKLKAFNLMSVKLIKYYAVCAAAGKKVKLENVLTCNM